MKRIALALLACLLLVSWAWAEPAIDPEARCGPYAPHKECYAEDGSGYHDDSIDVRVETFRAYDTPVTAAYVTISDPCQIRGGVVGSYSSPTIGLAVALAKSCNAVVAIDGDYYAHHNEGIVVRNTRLIRMNPCDSRDTLIIDDQGNFTILPHTTREDYESFSGNVSNAFCFGPGLVIDGVPLTDDSTVTLQIGKNKPTQRAAIGQLGPLQYVLVTCDGPDNQDSVGMTLLQWAETVAGLGCINAYNLDGGTSAAIVLNGKKINSLSSGRSRSVSDMIYFATLVP